MEARSETESIWNAKWYMNFHERRMIKYSAQTKTDSFFSVTYTLSWTYGPLPSGTWIWALTKKSNIFFLPPAKKKKKHLCVPNSTLRWLSKGQSSLSSSLPPSFRLFHHSVQQHKEHKAAGTLTECLSRLPTSAVGLTETRVLAQEMKYGFLI